jgi:hypothetical protein
MRNDDVSPKASHHRKTGGMQMSRASGIAHRVNTCRAGADSRQRVCHGKKDLKAEVYLIALRSGFAWWSFASM